MSIYALILCGGSGTRMKSAENKTLLPVDGVPAVIRCLRAFRGHTDGAVLAVKAGEEERFRQVLSAYGETVYALVKGGADRQESAHLALQALPKDAQIALIHDGARPFVTGEIIERVIGSVRETGSGVAAVPARDTIKRADEEGRVLETLDRNTLFHMQTPQGFYVKDLLSAHARATARYTDDAALMESAGFPVRLVMGGYENIKLTSPEDLKMTGNMPLPRIGQGYDAHRLTEGRELWLCGVKVPYEKGLLGHSDADAGLHALMDALLGAAALGDIGKLFPDSDDRYKGISSLLLLREVNRVLKENGFAVGNCDVTIVAQAPRLAPYIGQMRQAIAEGLEISPSQVSVKATTTEKMGFEGAKEGISAHAVALICQETAL